MNCILQDSKGFLWFGTNDGLNKYDGYSFTVYGADEDTVNSLSYWTLDKAQIPPMTFPKATRNGLKSQEKPTFIQFSASFIALESFREG